MVDRSGVLWLGSNAGGLRYVDVAAQGFALYREGSADVPGLDHSYVRAVCRARDGVLWVGTPRGLNRITRSPGKRIYASTSSDGFLKLPHPNVQAIHEDRDGNLWIGTAGGLAVRERASGTLHSYRADPAQPGSLSDDYVHVIHEGPDGQIWIGTLGKGVDEFDRETRSFTHYGFNRNDPARLSNGTIHAIASDRRGRLWVGTAAGLAVLESP
jgi:ligand-binding sensor domain-containing protein